MESSKDEIKPKRRKAPIAVFLIGLAVLVAGVACLVINLTSEAKLRDAEYLVEVGEWQREDAPAVIWNFTEIGEGALTTDSHGNDYPFKWAMEGDVLKIEAEWLYGFDNEYSYVLDQGAKTLVLTAEDGVWTFVPVGDDSE